MEFPEESDIDLIISVFGSITINREVYTKLKNNRYHHIDELNALGIYRIWLSNSLADDMCIIPKNKSHTSYYQKMTFEKAYKLAKYNNFI